MDGDPGKPPPSRSHNTLLMREKWPTAPSTRKMHPLEIWVSHVVWLQMPGNWAVSPHFPCTAPMLAIRTARLIKKYLICVWGFFVCEINLTGNKKSMWLCFIFTKGLCFLMFPGAQSGIPGGHHNQKELFPGALALAQLTSESTWPKGSPAECGPHPFRGLPPPGSTTARRERGSYP